MTTPVTVNWSTPANESVNHPIGLVGASPYVRADPTLGEGPTFRLGTIANGIAGQRWVWVGPAGASLAAGASPTNGVAIAVNTATFVPAAGTGFLAYAPLLAGQYGFVAEVGI